MKRNTQKIKIVRLYILRSMFFLKVRFAPPLLPSPGRESSGAASAGHGRGTKSARGERLPGFFTRDRDQRKVQGGQGGALVVPEANVRCGP